MKVNAALIKQLRDERAWSQEHLAAVAGLSRRTLQRVEAEASASAETRMAIGAALGIDVARLSQPASAPSEAPAPIVQGVAPPDPAAIQPTTSTRISHWQYRLRRFFVLASLFVGLDVYESGFVTWSKWVVLFWGVCLALRAVGALLVRPALAARH